MPRIRALKKVKRTPRPNRGTVKGMLFQVQTQLAEKKKDLSRIRGDLAYLQRKERKLERELLYMENGGNRSNESNSSNH